LGGGADPNDLYGLPVRVAELYDPALDVWTEMASQASNRTYHSTALLLPDGRVISAGSDGGDLPRTVEYCSPPYLFKGPGDYMLFILNSDRVPSIAPIIHVESRR
jgi:hypothetical protein